MVLGEVVQVGGAVARLTRLRGAGQTALFFLAGASITETFAQSSLPWLFALAVVCHAIGNAVNDIADLPFDASDPSRQLRPLVSAQLGIEDAVVVVLLLYCLFGALLAAGRWHRLGVEAALLLVTVLLLGNVYQKRVGPMLTIMMDILFGGVVASPLFVVPLLIGASPSRSAVLLGCAVVFEMMLLNGVAGNLKDIAADAAAGVRTTALVLGVRPRPGTALLPRRYINYCRCLQGGFWILTVASVCVSGLSSRATLILFGLLGALAALDVMSLHRLLSVRRPVKAGGAELYTSVEFAGFLLVAACEGRPIWLLVGLVMAVAVYAIALGVESVGASSRAVRAET